jgi:predicted anti-sigma-YlaC factor YlaD
MNGNEHDRAVDLVMLRDLEGMADADARWLEIHLQECEECAGFDRALSGAAHTVRAVTVMASAALVDSTRARVRVRAQQLRERQARTMLIAVSFCLGVVTSTLTAWVWWEFGGWVADRLGLPSGIVGPGVLLFWLLPAIVIAVLMVTCPPTLFEGSLMQRYMKDRLRGIE